MQRVLEHSRCGFEAEMMLPLIGEVLGFVPLKQGQPN